jgi:hypothetical protein
MHTSIYSNIYSHSAKKINKLIFVSKYVQKIDAQGLTFSKVLINMLLVDSKQDTIK